ncbi:Nup93/Nic96-domain-containing protein [Phaeosphaeriaceae sp. PMI808]|nr:Nup93/Nic96-domain-containing protein [Phaeosphaeriaceae sp. PMI808]
MSSLFGNLGASTSGAPAAKPLFGAAPSTSTGATPSLFGNLGGTTAPAGTPQPAGTGGLGGSLFGGTLGAAKPATTSAFPSLGAPAAPQAQAQTGGFSSLFTKPAATQQSNMANPQQTTGLGQSSLFGAAPTQQQSQPQQQQQQQQQQGAPVSQSNVGTSRSVAFDQLLERGRKRIAGENGGSNFDELPSLQLGLGDIARKVRNLGAGGPSADQARDGAQDRAAHYLLSASGVKIGSTLRDLNQFSTQAGIPANGTSQNFLDTDVDSYISNLHSQSTLSLIQEGLEQSKRDFDAFLEDNVQIEWDKQRQRIYEHFGLGRQSEDMAASQATFGNTTRGAFGRSTRKGRSMGPKGASVNGASTFRASTGGPPVIGNGQSVLNGREGPGSSMSGAQAGPRDRYERDKQEKFMDEVKKLNDARQRELPFSVLHAFSGVEKAAGTEHSDHFINAYGALTAITGEKPEVEASTPGSNNPKSRSFTKDYLDEQPNSAASVRMRKRILDGSRTFLEKKFLEQVDEVLRRNPTEALVGGVPSLLNKVRGFVRAKVAFKELGDHIEQFQRIGDTGEEYPWIIVFYLLRAGLLAEAADYVREKRNFFQNTDRNFQAAIQHYATDPERRLSPDLHQKISHVHAQRARLQAADDPYRTACYKIVGRCDLSRRNLDPIKETMDDWVWLQFNLAREGNRAEENAGEIYGLEELRTSIREIGQRHFNEDAEAAGGYGVYFYLTTLAGMFESALGYLYNHNYVSTVHFAIALDYYGLLRVSDWASGGSEVLTYTTRQQPQLSFGRVVGAYTADFRAARADAAADYLILICLNADLPGDAGKQQTELCHEALRELVLETREFSTLLGDVKSNGQTTPGLIQERVPLLKLSGENGLLNTITREAAKMADDNGRTNDAILLCHLAAEYDSVIAILNRSLAEALSVELGQEPLRLEPLKPRLTPAEMQQQQQQRVSDSTSMSMLGTDDPVELAKKVLDLYNANSLWWRKVSQINRETVGILYHLNEAKKVIERGDYMSALDHIQQQNVLPLRAAGNLSEIRASANSFSSYPPEIARNIGNVLLWCIGCCSRHREHLLTGTFDDPMRKVLADQLLQKAKDLMVFAGLIRYKLPPKVFETLAREGQDVGAY